MPKSNIHAYIYMAKFSKTEILMSRAVEGDLPAEQQHNLQMLVDRLNALFKGYSRPITVSSGYRRPVDNAAANGALQSWHMQCAAVDLHDADGTIWAYCLAHLDTCKALGLWLEDKRWTPTWVHLQIYAPKSGARIFKPNSGPAPAPNAWSGDLLKPKPKP